MCGIAAILLKPQERSEDDWREIKNIFTRNLLANEERGRSATGLAIMQADGRVDLYKQPLPASEFVMAPGYWSLLKNIGPQTTLLLGHTRLPTKGSPLVAANNHPLQVGPIFGVHSGEIENDDALFRAHGYSRQAQVDSEIIFHLLESVPPALANHSYLIGVSKCMKLLRGEFTFLSCDQRTPHRLLVFRHNNPLCVHFHAKWNSLVFSSRYTFLRQAFGRSTLTEGLAQNQFLLFDARALPQRSNSPVAALPLYSGDPSAHPVIMPSLKC